MDNDVLDYLSDIGYPGPLKDEAPFNKALELGVKDAAFRDLVVWLCQELTRLLQLDETVGAVTQEADLSNFVMEISSLLKELSCPYQELVEGPVSERLVTKDQRLRLLVFLLSELMAAKIVQIEKPSSAPELRLRESETAKDLKNILLALKFPRPPDNIAAKDLFSKVETKLKEVVRSAPPVLCGKPLLAGMLSTDQWNKLTHVQAELQQEYRLRREMLLKRLDVTVQSFEWSEQAKGKEDAIARAFLDRRRDLAAEPSVELADVLAARQDSAIVEKTSSSAARKNTHTSVHKVIIGRVPDRGGRPSEQDAPPPEMPSWQKERAQGGGGSGGGLGGFSRGGGGRVQGGWNQRDDRGDKGPRGDQQDSRREHRGGHRGGPRGGGERGGRGRDYRN